MDASNRALAPVAISLLVLALPAAAGDPRSANVCVRTTSILATACQLESQEDFETARAICLNESDVDERQECFDGAAEARNEARSDCREVRDARNEVCAAEGLGGRYDPAIDPADFVDEITNPYAPFSPGRTWVYQAETDEGLEVVEIEVLEEKKEIEGVECTVVRDTVRLDGVLIEDTLDYLAQDVHGNVWYFGELAQNFEDGELVDLDGSFTAGSDGAKPGFWMKAAPIVGETYRQEWFVGEAEDVATVVSTDSAEPVPFDNGGPVLQTRDFNPLEPDSVELKYYVPGVGLVLETKPGTTERLELVEFDSD